MVIMVSKMCEISKMLGIQMLSEYRALECSRTSEFGLILFFKTCYLVENIGKVLQKKFNEKKMVETN